MERTPRRGVRPFRRCPCGVVLTYPEWQGLPLVGHVADDDVERIEHRNCPRCRTTFTRRTQLVSVHYVTEHTHRGLIVWRQTGAGEPIALGRAFARVFESTAAAEGMIEIERSRDRSAARRLGIALAGDDV